MRIRHFTKKTESSEALRNKSDFLRNVADSLPA